MKLPESKNPKRIIEVESWRAPGKFNAVVLRISQGIHNVCAPFEMEIINNDPEWIPSILDKLLDNYIETATTPEALKFDLACRLLRRALSEFSPGYSPSLAREIELFLIDSGKLTS